MSQSKPVGNLAAIGFKVQGPPTPDPLPPQVTSLDAATNKPTPVQYFWDEIPAELKALPQWVTWRYIRRDGKKWDKVPFQANMNTRASSTDPATWCSFEEAVQFANHYDGIGFVLVDGNGLAIIDLDDKVEDPAGPEELQFFTEVVANFATYTELSVGGTGAHIVCRGKLPEGIKGRRTGHIEVYTSERYLTFTGNTDLSTLRFVPPGVEEVTEVADCQRELDLLMGRLGTATGAARPYSDDEIDVAETRTIEAIWIACAEAENKDKFRALWEGDWAAIGHMDHSLADMQLMEFFRFQGASIAQAIDLHEKSALATSKRTDKKKHHTYPMRTARKVFAIGYQERESARAMQAQATTLANQFLANQAAHSAPQSATAQGPSFVLQEPPGMLGNLARMFYSQSHIPNQQISIVAALAYMAGLAGLNWQTPTKTGLNINVIIVAPSGMGKEAATDLPMKLFNDTKRAFTLPESDHPFFSGALVSGQAMVKTLARKRCMVHHRNEVGRLFREWSNDKNPVVAGIKESLLTIYSKSAYNSTLGGMAYSNKDNDIEDPGACALSIVGDVTPSELFPNIQHESSTDGGLSRMEFVQVHGLRPELNYNAMHDATPEILEWSRALIAHSCHLRNNEQYIFVQFADEAAQKAMMAFGSHCTAQVNSYPEGFIRQTYNRAYIKTLKYASLCAVADNPYSPAITTAHVAWATQLVEGGISLFEKRVQDGEVGQDDTARYSQLQHVMRRYLSGELVATPKLAAGYAIKEKEWNLKVISRSTFSRILSTMASFRSSEKGVATRALDSVLKDAVERGALHKLEKAELVANGFSAQISLYRIIDLNA